jgi:hypothetical protein
MERLALFSGPSPLTFLSCHLVANRFAGALDVRDPTIGFGAWLLFGRHRESVRQKVLFVSQLVTRPCLIIRGAEKGSL